MGRNSPVAKVQRTHADCFLASVIIDYPWALKVQSLLMTPKSRTVKPCSSITVAVLDQYIRQLRYSNLPLFSSILIFIDPGPLVHRV